MIMYVEEELFLSKSHIGVIDSLERLSVRDFSKFVILILDD